MDNEVFKDIDNIKYIDNLDGWTTVRKMAEKESVTVQTIYYRAKIGQYSVICLDKIILVKFKDPKRLRRRETQTENKA